MAYREYFRRVEEPMGLGWLRNAGPCSLPASRAPRRAVLRLVEHLRSSGRAGPAYGGYHQSAIALACHCHADAACETNNDNCGEFTRPGVSRRERTRETADFGPGNRPPRKRELSFSGRSAGPLLIHIIIVAMNICQQ